MPVVQNEKRRWRRFWPELLLAGMIVLGTVLFAMWSLREEGHYPNLVVEAPAYVWPRGCPPDAYGRLSRVPKLCRTAAYRLNDPTRLGLLTTGKNNRWYRIGDDALLLGCFRLCDDCTIVERVVGKFVRPAGGGRE